MRLIINYLSFLLLNGKARVPGLSTTTSINAAGEVVTCSLSVLHVTSVTEKAIQGRPCLLACSGRPLSTIISSSYVFLPSLYENPYHTTHLCILAFPPDPIDEPCFFSKSLTQGRYALGVSVISWKQILTLLR